jgi:hypothetical protein
LAVVYQSLLALEPEPRLDKVAPSHSLRVSVQRRLVVPLPLQLLQERLPRVGTFL